MQNENLREYSDYKFYLKLAKKYEGKNINKQYLCYEQALFLCNDEEKVETIKCKLHQLKLSDLLEVNNVAIVILSYNNLKLTEECITSIKINNAFDSYEIIVVDNGSNDGSKEWLKKQSDIKLILNNENKGFPEGCNQGILKAEEGFDILLLNNDTIVMPNSIFWLRMGLYENEQIGATGSVSNDVVNYQQVSKNFHTLEEWKVFAKHNNVFLDNPYEKKAWLVGFAMLVKRRALDKIGLLDTRFSPGNYEDNDYSIRLILNGYKLLLCKNSFIYHYGSKGFLKNKEKFIKLLMENEKKFIEKYNFNYLPYSEVDSAIINLISPLNNECNILEIGCKMGCTLARLESLYPQVHTVGIEDNENLYKISKELVEVYNSEFLKKCLISHLESFDYIIMDQTLMIEKNPTELLCELKKLLKSTGVIILSLKNLDYFNISLKSKDQAVTLNQIVEICNYAKLYIENIYFKKENLIKFDKNESNKVEEEILYIAERFIIELR